MHAFLSPAHIISSSSHCYMPPACHWEERSKNIRSQGISGPSPLAPGPLIDPGPRYKLLSVPPSHGPRLWASLPDGLQTQPFLLAFQHGL